MKAVDRPPVSKRVLSPPDPDGTGPDDLGSWSHFKRCVVILLSTCIFVRLSSFVWHVDVGEDTPCSWLPSLPHSNWPHPVVGFEELEKIAISYPKADRAKEWSRYYTSGPHLGGQNYSQAVWTKEKLEGFGFKTQIETYDIYVNYPLGHRLALLKKKESGDEFEVDYEAKLEEPVLEKDTTSGLKDRIPTFHGYSASGNATGPLVFANYGTFADYDALLAHNISLEGAIVIVKYGLVFRGLKVKRAQELGALGVIMYSDPGDDYGITPEEGYDEYPEGPARHHQSVQRGSVEYLSFGPGDPTTPGYPSLPGCNRTDPHALTPKIPSIPISYDDAIPLLLALNGQGPLYKDLGWSAGGLEYKGVQYNIGPTPPNLAVNLVNEQNYTITPMWNVIATLPGSLGCSEGAVIAGNHHDAWIAGGAGDPNSGSAALLEVAGALAAMRKTGWTPIRDIVLASWDGEEYGLVGSTEWVEDHARSLTEKAIAYINLDVGAVGSYFKAAANPLLFGLISDAAAKVPIGDPEEGKTIADTWSGRIATLGSGSDYTAFQDFLGIPSTDMGFKNGVDDPVWMYHSNYDSFSWMEMYGDRDFIHHEAISRLWAMMLLHLSSRDILPLNVTEYAVRLEGYLSKIKSTSSDTKLSLADLSTTASKDRLSKDLLLNSYGHPAEFAYTPPNPTLLLKHKHKKHAFSLNPLPKIFSWLTKDAITFSSHLDYLSADIREFLLLKKPSLWNYPARLILWRRVSEANMVLRKFDRVWLNEDGLGGGRNWFKHIVFAPGRWTGYAGAVFPGLGESWEDGDFDAWEKAKDVVRGCVDKAREKLHKATRSWNLWGNHYCELREYL